jgi:hypothetical protein
LGTDIEAVETHIGEGATDTVIGVAGSGGGVGRGIGVGVATAVTLASHTLVQTLEEGRGIVVTTGLSKKSNSGSVDIKGGKRECVRCL